MTLGEALIDFIPHDSTNMIYQKNPGGAPANVAVGVARLGAKSTFVSKVGDDVLGHFLKQTLDEFKVDTNHVKLSEEAKTNIVFVTLDDEGDRSFEFYVTPSADQLLRAEEIDERLFKAHRVFHFGSITLIQEPAMGATKRAIQLARENDMIVSYDPNLRLPLWDDEQQAKEHISSVLDQVDVLKLSEEELTFLTGEKDLHSGAAVLKAQYNIPLIFVTLGAEGSFVFAENDVQKVPAMKVKAVDTTGAGDAFVSGILYQLNELQGDVSSITLEQAVRMATFAAVSGGLAASAKGAMTALPTLHEVHDVQQKMNEGTV